MKWSELLCEKRMRESEPRKNSMDLRSEFEKDYHRIIGSASFRRLQDKTQVFPLDKSDFIRTRLTHSLEVASFAKSLGQYVGSKIIDDKLDDEFTVRERNNICSILECAGLLHDIGNPPFGHFGETLIREWFSNNMSRISYRGELLENVLNMQMKQDFLNFEGNTQALRVVTKLHYLVDEHGMNLSKALLGTIIKYPVSSVEINKSGDNVKNKKMGYFYADKAEFENIIESIGTNGNRHPLTFLLEAADDIAYRTADIEDAIKKGCFTYGFLLEQLKLNLRDEDIHYIDRLEVLYERAIKSGNDEPHVYAVQNWVVYIQGKVIYAAAKCFLDNYDDIMNGNYKHDLFHENDATQIMWLLGDIAIKNVFQSESIFKSEISASFIINSLLDQFIPAILNYDTDKELTNLQKRLVKLISQNYKRIYHIYSKDRSENEKLYLRLLLVTDYVCGMTDSYAKSLYEELSGKI